MKIVVSIYDDSTIKKVAPYVDGVVLMVPQYSYVYSSLDVDKAIKEARSLSLDVILSCSRIFMEDEMNEVSLFFDHFPDVKFLVSDLGLVEILKEKGRINDVIYDSSTLVCNALDLSFYQDQGFDAISMSNEIPISDVISSQSKNNTPLFYHVFGRKMMFYSKRRLLECYKNFRNLSFDNDSLFLREEKRSYRVPIFENANGTYIFRHYFISLLDIILDLSSFKYGYFESICLNDDEIVEVLNIFHKVLNKEMTIEAGGNALGKLSLPIQDGFAYSDSVHIKEGEVCEK